MKKEYINYRIIADKELLEFLRSDEEERFSKMDALCDFLTRHPVKAEVLQRIEETACRGTVPFPLPGKVADGRDELPFPQGDGRSEIGQAVTAFTGCLVK